MTGCLRTSQAVREVMILVSQEHCMRVEEMTPSLTLAWQIWLQPPITSATHHEALIPCPLLEQGGEGEYEGG